MKINMKQWFQDTTAQQHKKPIPILSFPCITLLGHTIKELVSSSELQAKGMELIAHKYATGASVSMMELSVEAQAFGAEVQFYDDNIPTVLDRLIKNEKDLDTLTIPAIGAGRTGIFVEAMEKASARIEDRPVFAGVIGPFSLASRLMGVPESLSLCTTHPTMVHQCLEKATTFLTQYCKAFKDVGANGVIIAEPVAGILSANLNHTFSVTYAQRIVQAVQDDHFAVIYHNCGNNTLAMANDLLEIHAMGYHFGNAIALKDMLDTMPTTIPVLGNLDPLQFRDGTPNSLGKLTIELLEQCAQYPNFIISSGCDLPYLTPWENIDSFFKAVKEFQTKI